MEASEGKKAYTTVQRKNMKSSLEILVIFFVYGESQTQIMSPGLTQMSCKYLCLTLQILRLSTINFRFWYILVNINSGKFDKDSGE
jgi:hypothetical protein